MLNQVTRETIKEMSARGISNRQIGKLLGISRSTVRKILRKADGQGRKESKAGGALHRVPDALMIEIFGVCKGNAVRIKEILKEVHGVDMPYSTLTRLIRRLELRTPVKAKGNFNFLPGAEMQHDTSPFVIKIAGKTVQVQCASLVLWYSRKLYIQFYPCFTRFEARLFLCEAIEFMEGACCRCMNDNTSVVVVAGTGPDAVIAPEIEKLGNLFGTRFQAHAVNHPERKGQVEKQFFYVGCNFLAGRIFTSWEDLNRQARQWCVTVANEKVKRILGMSPNAAHVLEKPHLRALPAYIPPVYDSFFRVVDARCSSANTLI